MTGAGLEEANLFPSEGEIYYIGADPNEIGTRPLNRFNNGPDHMDSAALEVEGYWIEGPLGFAWKSRSLRGLSPMLESFNAATGDHAVMDLCGPGVGAGSKKWSMNPMHLGDSCDGCYFLSEN